MPDLPRPRLVTSADLAPAGTLPAVASPLADPAPPAPAEAGPPSIGFVFGLVLVVNLAALLGVATLAFTWSIDRIGERATVHALEARGSALQSDIAATLDRSLSRLELVAERLGGRVGPEAAEILDGLVEKDPLVEWAGLARLDGTVVAASGGEAVGTSVALRTWFAEALTSPFVADLPAFMEATLAGVSSAHPEPRGHKLTLAVPVKDEHGRVTGVVGAHLGPEGGVARFRAMAKALGVEAKLVTASGDTLMATEGAAQESWSAASARAAAIGVTGVVATGRNEAVSPKLLVADLASERLPKLPWSLAVRLPKGESIAANTPPPSAVVAFVAVALFAYGLAAFLFVRLYLRPIRLLVSAAVDIAEGRHDAYPFESRRSSEAASLSAAIGVIERRLSGGSGRPDRGRSPAMVRKEAA